MKYKTHRKQDIVRKSLKNSFLIFLNISFLNKKNYIIILIYILPWVSLIYLNVMYVY